MREQKVSEAGYVAGPGSLLEITALIAGCRSETAPNNTAREICPVNAAG
jgi:hypothetical protein